MILCVFKTYRLIESLPLYDRSEIYDWFFASYGTPVMAPTQWFSFITLVLITCECSSLWLQELSLFTLHTLLLWSPPQLQFTRKTFKREWLSHFHRALTLTASRGSFPLTESSVWMLLCQPVCTLLSGCIIRRYTSSHSFQYAPCFAPLWLKHHHFDWFLLLYSDGTAADFVGTFWLIFFRLTMRKKKNLDMQPLN